MQTFNSGARWHRWEPHVHAPGTILNDQFAGPEKMGKLSSLFRDGTYERVAETARRRDQERCAVNSFTLAAPRMPYPLAENFRASRFRVVIPRQSSCALQTRKT